MVSNKIFLIRTINIPKDVDENRLLREFSDCFDEGDENNYAVEEVNGNDYIFLRFPDYKVEKVCRVLDKYINYTIEEISHDVLVDCKEDISEILKNPEYKPFFDSFRIENAQVDDVLDKILIRGVDSLDDIDKQILNNVK